MSTHFSQPDKEKEKTGLSDKTHNSQGNSSVISPFWIKRFSVTKLGMYWNLSSLSQIADGVSYHLFLQFPEHKIIISHTIVLYFENYSLLKPNLSFNLNFEINLQKHQH